MTLIAATYASPDAKSVGRRLSLQLVLQSAVDKFPALKGSGILTAVDQQILAGYETCLNTAKVGAECT
jgi:hypothetical protein